MADDHYIRLEVPAALFNSLEERVRGKAITPQARDKLLDLLSTGEVIPLPMAHLDWSELEADAKRQGVSPADILWDRAKGTEPA